MVMSNLLSRFEDELDLQKRRQEQFAPPSIMDYAPPAEPEPYTQPEPSSFDVKGAYQPDYTQASAQVPSVQADSVYQSAPAVASADVGVQPPEYGPEMPVLNAPQPGGDFLGNAWSFLRDVPLPRAGGVPSNTTIGEALTPIPEAVALQNFIGDASGRALSTLAGMGTGVAPGLQDVGPSPQQLEAVRPIGEFLGESLVPTTPIEFAAAPLLGLTPADDALLGAGRAALRGGRAYFDDLARVGAGAVPETAVRDLFAPPALLRTEGTNIPRFISPTEGTGLPDVGGAAKLSREELIAKQKELLGEDAAMWAGPTGPEIDAAQKLSSGFYRDTGHVTKRANALAEAMDAMKAEPGELPQIGGGTFRRGEQAPSGVGAGQPVTPPLAGTAPAAQAVQPTLPGMPVPVVKMDVVKDAKLADELMAAAGLPRTLKASFDISAPGRQGLALAFRHPKEWASAWVPMIRAWNSEAGMQAVDTQIKDIMSKWTDVPKDSLHFYNVGPAAEGLERVPGFEPAGKGYVASILRKVPGLEKSERAYATFLNYQKAKTFDTMATALQNAGETNPERFWNLGQLVDHATGYGGAPFKGRFEGQTFFSQRYMTSRFQFLAEPIVQALRYRDLGAAKAATENLVAFAGGLTGVLALGNETGAWDAELDPRSSDFGKVRVGPQRIDFGAGFLPLIRTAAREVTGEAKAVTGGVYDVDRKNEALKFFRNKLAPIPSAAVNIAVGENAIGEPNPKILSLDTARDMLMPLIADAVLEAWTETGDPKAALRTFGAELVGGGTSTYGGGQAMQVQLADEHFGDEYDNLLAADQANINREIVESGIALPYRDRSGAWWQARDNAMARWQVDIGEELAADPFAQKALTLDAAADIEPSLVKWARDTYQLSRLDAEEAVDRFLRETQLNDYIQAYRKDVLAADPGYLQSWDEAYEKDETEFPPPKWAREFVASVLSPAAPGAGR